MQKRKKRKFASPVLNVLIAPQATADVCVCVCVCVCVWGGREIT
jgi:hypothetical protein